MQQGSSQATGITNAAAASESTRYRAKGNRSKAAKGDLDRSHTGITNLGSVVV